MATKNRSNELKLTRLYDAPVKVVWDAWTDPKQVAKWWGPRGFTLTTHSKDLRPGGSWVYTMHGPDGVDYPNKTTYLEVENYSRLVYDHGANDDRPALFRVTVVFKEVKGKTKMDMTMTLPTPEAAEQTRKFIKLAGGDSTWDRLAEYLEKGSTGKDTFVINRTFNVSADLLFKMWTDPKHLSKWLPPAGFNLTFVKSDIRTGGSAFYSMSNDSGVKFFGRSKYLEITAPSRLVYAQEFCDENENISRHPMAPTWPQTMLTTVTFSQEDEGQTRLTITTEAFGHTTPEEMEVFISAKSGMTMGWTGSLDKLEGLLAEM